MSLDTTFLIEWHKSIEVTKLDAQLHIIDGNLKDFSEYRYSLGYIKGLDDALKIADDLADKLQKE